MLLQRGAPVNDVSGEGTWLLRIACMNGDLDLTTHLPAHGADPNLTWSGLTALFDAVRADSIPCVDVLLAAGADINAQDVDGWTCLWSVPSVEMAHHLLAHGAPPFQIKWAICRKTIQASPLLSPTFISIFARAKSPQRSS